MEIIVNDVNIGYSKNIVIEDCNLKFNNSSLIGCIGSNGAGKSTFFKVISGILPAHKGEIKVNGKLVNSTADIVGHMSFFLDEQIFISYITAKQHLDMIVGINPILVEKYIEYFSFSYALNKKISAFSLGMKQIFLLIITLSMDSEIMLLDEILNGLDPKNKRLAIDLLEEKKQEKIIFLSSHQLMDLKELSDEFLVFNEKKIRRINAHSISIRDLEKKIFGIGDEI
ncbi:ATP-binding cassette domain-containing protein [Enterococcus entomosocium]|uniref:ATP-binding cassette domain-containing protein n=1 Tax=Enterococcus entomosocium TaxID=3034352 RepID=UPI003B5BF398